MIIDLNRLVYQYELPLARCLHVGAHHGLEDDVYQKLGIEPIYVEANPEVFKVLRQNCPNRQCHQVAISDRAGTADFHVTSFDQSSSLLKLKKHAEIYPKIVEKQVIQVPCTTIDSLMKRVGGTVDLINIDIQGAELLAFRGGVETLRQASCIMTEVNREELYAGCALIGDLDEFLGKLGYFRAAESFKFHKSWGDAVYLKREFARPAWKLALRGLRTWFPGAKLRRPARAA